MDMCRVCMSNGSSVMVPIFSRLDNIFIANMLAELSSIQIFDDDGLPTLICNLCISEMKSASTFVKKCRESDMKLRKMFKQDPEDPQMMFPIAMIGIPDIEIKNELSSDEQAQNHSDSDSYSVKIENESSDTDTDDDIPLSTRYNVKKKNNVRRKAPRKRGKTIEKIPLDGDPCECNGDVTRKCLNPKYKAKDGTINFRESDQPTDSDIRFSVIDFTGKICCGCSKIFETHEELLEHAKTAHTNKRNRNFSKEHECKICYRRYTSFCKLKFHMDLFATLKQLIVCSRCGVKFPEKAGAKRHAQHHPKSPVPFEQKPVPEAKPRKICCAVSCLATFETEEQLLQHCLSSHTLNKVSDPLVLNLKPVECDLCFKRFKTEASLKKHQKTNYMDLVHQCALCGLNFKSASILISHELKHKGEKPFQCDLCPRAYYTKGNLKSHMEVHSEIKKHICQVCGMSFHKKGTLTVHLLTHKEKMGFKCPICSNAYRAKNKLEMHMRTHTGERPFKCQYCGQAFAEVTNKKRHEMSHTGFRPYRCKLCNKGFMRKRYLQEHEITHSFNNS